MAMKRSEDPFDTVLSVVPSSKTEKTLKKLADEGYDDGPDPSLVLSISEGDAIEVGFRGNVTTKEHENIEFVYNSNLESETEFYACEVDKYLQKNFPVYRGVVEYHVEPDSNVSKAPITILNPSDAVDANMLRGLAEELGDEWKTVASHLNVSKPRVQAIIRNLQYGDQTESDARYEMLMTWIKKTPKPTDKVACLTTALIKSGRADLAEDIRARDRDFRNHDKV